MYGPTLYSYHPTGRGGTNKLEYNQRIICPWKWTYSPLQIMRQKTDQMCDLNMHCPSMTWDMVAIEATNFYKIQRFLVANRNPSEITCLGSPLTGKQQNIISKTRHCSIKDNIPATILTDSYSPTSSRWSHAWLSVSISKRSQQCTDDNDYSTPSFPWDLSWCRTQKMREPSSCSPLQANQATVNACQVSILIHNKVVNEARFITDLAFQRAVRAQGHWRYADVTQRKCWVPNVRIILKQYSWHIHVWLGFRFQSSISALHSLMFLPVFTSPSNSFYLHLPSFRPRYSYPHPFNPCICSLIYTHCQSHFSPWQDSTSTNWFCLSLRIGRGITWSHVSTTMLLTLLNTLLFPVYEFLGDEKRHPMLLTWYGTWHNKCFGASKGWRGGCLAKVHLP